MDLKSLFKLTPEKTVAPSSQKDAVAAAVQQNTEAKQEGETYYHYGSRICGLVHAENPALAPFLTKIYIQERKRQQDDENLQGEIKKQIGKDITRLETEKQKQENNLNNLQEQEKGTNKKIEDYDNEIINLKAEEGKKNKKANMMMWLGIIILIPLTIYLFIFYSSTFYMGFVMSPDEVTNEIGLGTAMFNPQALSDAWNKSITAFCFVILVPVIFLALGFLLHFFSAEPGVKGKIQAALIILLTFSFDCILAFKIGYTLDYINSLMIMGEHVPYSISMAVNDVNIWAVIFCGFIAYIIWGLVFDLAIKGYENRFSNKRQIEAIELKKDNENKNLKEINNQMAELKNKIIGLEGEIRMKQIELTHKVVYYIDAIKEALGDFFAGWIVVMEGLGRQSAMVEAKSIYNQTVQQLFNKTEK